MPGPAHAPEALRASTDGWRKDVARATSSVRLHLSRIFPYGSRWRVAALAYLVLVLVACLAQLLLFVVGDQIASPVAGSQSYAPPTRRIATKCPRLPAAHDPWESPRLSVAIVVNEETSAGHELAPKRFHEVMNGTGLSVDEVIVVICGGSAPQNSLDQPWLHEFSDPKRHVVLYEPASTTHAIGAAQTAACFNTAMRSSPASLFLLLRDSDLLPIDDQWIVQGLEVLAAHPMVSALSASTGSLLGSRGWISFGEAASAAKETVYQIPYRCKEVDAPFMFTNCAHMTPLFIRPELLSSVGGFPLDPQAPGWEDCGLSLMAWENGHATGVYRPSERVAGDVRAINTAPRPVSFSFSNSPTHGDPMNWNARYLAEGVRP